MTNVLVGIIGVILFIGLAIAGAFFLGPRFHQAQSDSKAMSLTQMGTQIVAAMSVKRGEEGTPFPARTSMTALTSSRYLSVLPMNPFLEKGGWPFRALYSGDVKSPYYYADVVFVSIGHGDEAKEVCESVSRQTGGGANVQTLPQSSGDDIAPAVTRTAGCFRIHALGIDGEAAPGDYVVYARI